MSRLFKSSNLMRLFLFRRNRLFYYYILKLFIFICHHMILYSFASFKKDFRCVYLNLSIICLIDVVFKMDFFFTFRIATSLPIYILLFEEIGLQLTSLFVFFYFFFLCVCHSDSPISFLWCVYSLC